MVEAAGVEPWPHNHRNLLMVHDFRSSRAGFIVASYCPALRWSARQSSRFNPSRGDIGETVYRVVR